MTTSTMTTSTMTPLHMPHHLLDTTETAMYYSPTLKRPVYVRRNPVQNPDNDATQSLIIEPATDSQPRHPVEPSCQHGGLRYPRTIDVLSKGNRARRNTRVDVVRQRVDQKNQALQHEKRSEKESKSKSIWKTWVKRALAKLDCRRLV